MITFKLKIKSMNCKNNLKFWNATNLIGIIIAEKILDRGFIKNQCIWFFEIFALLIQFFVIVHDDSLEY